MFGFGKAKREVAVTVARHWMALLEVHCRVEVGGDISRGVILVPRGGKGPK
ncbi:MAG TPA: hypothetical protein VLK32_05790 [Bacillota bacterium]|nr:hypothetical protein [Bacillota bacterium]